MSKLKNELRTLRDENQELRNEVERVRKDYTILHTALEEIVNLSSLSPMINDIARKALVDIGTTGCPAGLTGRNGLTDENFIEVFELQEQLNTAKKYIEHLIGTIKHDGHLGTVQTDWILPNLEKALEVIGGDGCPVCPIGVDGLTKYVQPTIWHNTTEFEGSGDE